LYVTTYKPQLVEHVRESCYWPHFTTPGGVPNTNHSLYFWHKINTSMTTTYDCLIEWKPSVRATTRTLTPLTHTISSHNSRNVQCSSSILSHNLRDVIPRHNSRNAMCLSSIPSHNSRNVIPSHNSRNALAKSYIKILPKVL